MAKKVKVSATQLASNWENGLNGAAAKIEAGINSVTENPAKLAADRSDFWLQQVSKSKDKYVSGLNKVTLESWKQSAIQKGIPALQNSLTMGKSKVEANAGKLISTLNSALASMPARGATLDQNLNRVKHVAQAMQKAYS